MVEQFTSQSPGQLLSTARITGRTQINRFVCDDRFTVRFVIFSYQPHATCLHANNGGFPMSQVVHFKMSMRCNQLSKLNKTDDEHLTYVIYENWNKLQK